MYVHVKNKTINFEKTYGNPTIFYPKNKNKVTISFSNLYMLRINDKSIDDAINILFERTTIVNVYIDNLIFKYEKNKDINFYKYVTHENVKKWFNKFHKDSIFSFYNNFPYIK